MDDRHPMLIGRTWLRPMRMWLCVAGLLAAVYFICFFYAKGVASTKLVDGAVSIKELRGFQDNHAVRLVRREDGTLVREFGPRAPRDAVVSVDIEGLMSDELVDMGGSAVAIFGSEAPDDKGEQEEDDDDVARSQEQQMERLRTLERLGYLTAPSAAVSGAPGVDLGEYGEGEARALYERMRRQGRLVHIEEVQDESGAVRYRVHGSADAPSVTPSPEPGGGGASPTGPVEPTDVPPPADDTPPAGPPPVVPSADPPAPDPAVGTAPTPPSPNATPPSTDPGTRPIGDL